MTAPTGAGPLGARLRDRRLELGRTLKEIGAAMGKSVVYVSDIERGNRRPIRSDVLSLIAGVYGLPLEEIEELSAMSQDSIPLDVDGADLRKREAALTLARAWDDLTPEQINRIRKITEEGRDGAD